MYDQNIALSLFSSSTSLNENNVIEKQTNCKRMEKKENSGKKTRKCGITLNFLPEVVAYS
jgi:hypothetical protein